MKVNVFDLTPNASDVPEKDYCFDCIRCCHLISITVDSSHQATIECDYGEEKRFLQTNDKEL